MKRAQLRILILSLALVCALVGMFFALTKDIVLGIMLIILAALGSAGAKKLA